ALVACAREVKASTTAVPAVRRRRGLDGVDVDVHLPRADEPGLRGEVVVELVVDELGPPGANRLARFAEGVVLVTAAADRADDPAVAEDEHLGADALRRGAGGRHDGDERRRLASFQRLRDGGEHFTVPLPGLYGADRISRAFGFADQRRGGRARAGGAGWAGWAGWVGWGGWVE